MMPTRFRVTFEQRLFEHPDAVHAGHHQIAQQDVEVAIHQRFDSLDAAGRSLDLVAFVAQRLAQGILQFHFVVHNEQSAKFPVSHSSFPS